MYANDNRDFFPTNSRASGLTHASWISTSTYYYMVNEAKVSTNSLTCPNRLKNGVGVTLRLGGNGARIGYYSLYSLPTEGDTRRRDLDYGNQPAPFDSPKKTTQLTPYSILMADVIEKGTDNVDSDVLGAAQNVTQAPHTKTGYKFGALVEPEAIGSQGGHVINVDGSVDWRSQKKMKPHATLWQKNGSYASDYIGYW